MNARDRGRKATADPRGGEVGHRRTERSRDTKEAILEGAAKVLSDQGYEATSLELVASTAGVTKGTVYYHFDSKEAIYAAVIIRYVSDALRQAEEIAASTDDPIEALSLILDAIIADTMDTSKRYIHYQEIVRVRDEVYAMVRDVQRAYMNTVAELISRAQEQGGVIEGDAKVLALLLIGAVGRTARWYDADGRVPPDAFTGLIRKFVLHGLLTGEAKLAS